MDEEGMAPGFMRNMDWETLDMATATDELINSLSRHVGEFFLKHTKEELFREAVKRRMSLYPVQTVADIAADPQLKERRFWGGIEHLELERQLLYPNSPCAFSEKLVMEKRRAPFLGEHNQEIYMGELGFSREEIERLKASGVI